MAKLTLQQKNYQRLYGLLFGSLFAAFVGLMWTGLFSSFIGGTTKIILAPAIVLAGVLLIVRGLYLRAKYPLPKNIDLPYFSSGRFWLKFYGVIIVEFVAIYGLIRLLNAHNMENGLFPLIVFVVGAHFFPLAYLNGNKIWYLTASVLCISTALLALTTSAQQTTHILGAQNSSVWGLGAAAIMVATMLATSLCSSQLYKQSISKS